MPNLRRTSVPLAWRNLTESKLRLAASVAGTAFAVTLMLMQTGFRNALLDSMVAVIRDLDGELFLVARNLYTLANPLPFPAERLDQARGFDDVLSASPVHIDTRRPRWRGPTDGIPHRVRVVAYPPEDRTLNVAPLTQNRERWVRPDTAMADALSKPRKLGRFQTGEASELSGRRVEVVGHFSMGTDFQNDGTLVLSEENYFSIFPDPRAGPGGRPPVTIGVLRVRPGADLSRLESAMRGALPPDVLVLSKAEFVAKEVGFWDRVAPIGTIFNIGVAMGFVVGVVICYQVLYADISDRLVEFGTLKAMGYSDARLFLIVIEQAVDLALLGFAAGLAISLLMYRWVHGATGLPMEFKPGVAVLVLALTVLMCVLSGCVAARRLVSVDPAQLYQ